jgi:hypothetical protein
MKFTYIGEYPAGRNSLEAYGGYVFRPGEAVDLPEQFAKKALRNRFFQAVPEPAPVHQPTVDADAAAKKARADLIAKAESLGVEFDKRWSAAKIQDAIDAHQAS